MDPEAFLDLANQVTKLKMYPYFDLAHAALCCLAVRDDLASGKIPFLQMPSSIFRGYLVPLHAMYEPANIVPMSL